MRPSSPPKPPSLTAEPPPYAPILLHPARRRHHRCHRLFRLHRLRLQADPASSAVDPAEIAQYEANLARQREEAERNARLQAEEDRRRRAEMDDIERRRQEREERRRTRRDEIDRMTPEERLSVEGDALAKGRLAYGLLVESRQAHAKGLLDRERELRKECRDALESIRDEYPRTEAAVEAHRIIVMEL